MELSLERIAELITKYNNIVITAHIHPDGDCLGSVLALNRYLVAIGKRVKIMIDDDIPALYCFLPGSQNIIKPNSEFLKADLLIVLDASDIERIGRVAKTVDAPILNIDHHISNTKFADYWYIDSNAAATGEIILRLLKLMQAPIDVDIATCLYTAIATDSGFFRYANTSADTMRYAAELIECGVKPHFVSEQLEAKPLSSIAALTKILETLELHYDGKIASITVLPDFLDSSDTTEGFINYPRIIEGVEVAIMFKLTDKDTCRVSFRSKQTDVSQLALGFGGGGHARAAGCTVTGSLNEIKEKVISATIRQLEGTV